MVALFSLPSSAGLSGFVGPAISHSTSNLIRVISLLLLLPLLLRGVFTTRRYTNSRLPLPYYYYYQLLLLIIINKQLASHDL